MRPPDDLRAQLPHALKETRFSGLGELQRGKVRDIYRNRDGQRLILITTDRLSAFDHVLTTIPFKGEVLNRLAAFWFEKTAGIIQNHVLDLPDANALVARACQPLPVEVVVRGYLTGSFWRDYQAGTASAAYGVPLAAGMRRDQRFETPLITPSTKAEAGQHDLPLSEAQVVAGLVPKAVWEEARAAALALFALGQEWARSRGLILVDTKYEFGLDAQSRGKLTLIDEIHTPDSSRYWIADQYQRRFDAGEEQQMLDKENVRQWLIRERGFQGHGPLPAIPDEVRVDLAQKYVAAYERISGETFPGEVGPVAPRIERNLEAKGYL
jgi:phosphoribosylaminoimidazole-succinocarboxamide synthase